MDLKKCDVKKDYTNERDVYNKRDVYNISVYIDKKGFKKLDNFFTEDFFLEKDDKYFSKNKNHLIYFLKKYFKNEDGIFLTKITMSLIIDKRYNEILLISIKSSHQNDLNVIDIYKIFVEKFKDNIKYYKNNPKYQQILNNQFEYFENKIKNKNGRNFLYQDQGKLLYEK